MALVTWIKQKDKIDGAMKAKVYSFFEKLQKDDTAPGLHIEPMHTPADPRVRTGRIDLNYRAVLFKVLYETIPHYFYYGAWPHDEAINIARSSVLKVNSVNGVLEVIRESTPDPVTTTPPQKEKKAGEQDSQAGDEKREPSGELWSNPLIGYGLVAADLVKDLGLDAEIVDHVFAASSEEDLFDVMAEAPEWQATALLELAAGTCIAEIQEKLSLTGYVDNPDESEEEKIRKALEHPATKMQFTFVGDNPEELKQVIEGGDFDAWRTFLHPEQRIYAERRYNGSFRLSGGAGTGKTVVLLHRARMLALSEPQSRIVLTTYTTTLADSLSTGLGKLDADLPRSAAPGYPGIYIGGVDSLVSRVLHGATDVEQRRAMKEVFGTESVIPGKVLDAALARHQWEAAINDVTHNLEPELANATFLQQEYETVVLPNFISSKDAYLTVPRTGRGTALNRSKRLDIWTIIAAYRNYNSIQMNCSFVELAHLATAVLRQRTALGGRCLADHVLVDESQDLHAGHWLFLRELADVHADDLFIAEDSQQRIYGQKVPLSRFGIAIVGRSRRLTLNYRTTQQNLDYAVRLLTGAAMTDMEGGKVPDSGYISARTGPLPEERSAGSFADELDVLADYLTQWRDEGVALENVGVLVRANYQVAKVVDGLKERGLTAKTASVGRDEPGIPTVMTMHRSKGMEFTRVVLFGISDQALPAKHQVSNVAPAERADALLRERSLLYVAATRARDGLVVTWSGKPSELLGMK
ncbi:3'-5' exonuclease [Arthrobacter mangrovi]|uniref:DNA 3'-5' helicase n=1 Tax=Arthrobacter mangrovi TaxID=2966350 RepID=A0ABQ5MPL9_9MICC|nr:3'-5' exonuclease [Arthrobacter mangrovi]GLB65929.1 DNA helicase [Arthrobacter mangrovi]